MINSEQIIMKVEQTLRLSINEQCILSSLGKNALNTNKTNKQ